MENLYRELADVVTGGEPRAVVTVVSTQGSTPRDVGSKMLVRPDGSTLGSIGGGALEAQATSDALRALAEGRSRMVEYGLQGGDADLGLCGGDVRVFIEVVNPAPVLLVIGSGHVGRSLAGLGSRMGFNVVVADDRKEYLTSDRLPAGVRTQLIRLDELAEQVDINDRCYVVIATRGHEQDEIVLRQVVGKPATYIGLLGSHGKVGTLFERLLADGVSEESLARVHAPVGLDVGAMNPEEIALSIMAEIVMVRRGGSGRSLADQWNPFHTRDSAGQDR
jgi:xanthine dehydrogenase accessory factor